MAPSRPPAHVRHYPLDIPLPFERYEHRRLTARDLLVHRIVSALLFPPTPELARAFDSHRKHRLMPRSDQHCCAYHRRSTRSKTIPQHNFGPIKQHDPCLARDVEVLRKMLVTRSDTEWVRQVVVKPAKVAGVLSIKSVFHVVPPRNFQVPATEPSEGSPVPTVEEEVLDLVRRHYMETDDACTRLWLQAIQPTQPSSYLTLPKTPAKRDSRKEVVADWRHWDEMHAAEDYKRWYEEDTVHLRALQAQTRTAHESRLFEGGAFLPELRRPQLEAKAGRMHYLHTMSVRRSRTFFAEERDGHLVQADLYPWLEPDVPRRVLHVPSWYSWRQKHNAFTMRMPAVDFASGRTGRGLDRDGVWSTSWWYGDNVPRGRTTRRRRRRAASEPPPGLFTAARLPVGFNSSRELLIFPKMTLATIDRRTRRRSLSRTRIAEQFNWDLVLEEPPIQPTRADILWKKAIATAAIKWPEFCKILSNIDAQPAPEPKWCANCASSQHITALCTSPCGYCGAPNPNPNCEYVVESRFQPKRRPWDPETEEDKFAPSQPGWHDNPHLAPDCPVSRQNHCKCTPFPQFHVAAQCRVLCSRDCGAHDASSSSSSYYPPGHFKHKNAMGCKSRCCMCGMRGHSGTKCKLKRCRCGGEHLGQDCGWHPECTVKGCDRFLCGVHCQGCGLDRARLDEGLAFVNRRCPACVESGTGVPVSASSSTTTTERVSLADDPSHRVSSDYENGPHNSQPGQPAGDDDADKPHKSVTTQKSEGGKGRGRRNKRKHRPDGPKQPPPKEEEEEKPWYAPLAPRTAPVAVSKSGKKGKWNRADTELPVRIGGCR